MAITAGKSLQQLVVCKSHRVLQASYGMSHSRDVSASLLYYHHYPQTVNNTHMGAILTSRLIICGNYSRKLKRAEQSFSIVSFIVYLQPWKIPISLQIRNPRSASETSKVPWQPLKRLVEIGGYEAHKASAKTLANAEMRPT